MIITSQGFGHFTDGLNNQDFAMETSRMVMTLDGCSGAKYSEVGTRLFAQLFSKKEECDSVEKFEDNVKSVFDDIIEMMKKYYPESEDLEVNFIMENLLFTIIACFETENEFIVKLFGDGYVFTKNVNDCVSYMKFSYGKYPPYFAYKYCNSPETANFKDYGFKTFVFDKSKFSLVGIGTDGIMPIAKGDVSGVDNALCMGNAAYAEMIIKTQRQKFSDDTTIALIGGSKENEKPVQIPEEKR